ncbi:MAG: SprT-like domain-containing protein [Planctomycetota bacterium]|jgi:hypothetical protein|nr:SprT-like domain-containing protein [Planctomycetota bacterium]
MTTAPYLPHSPYFSEIIAAPKPDAGTVAPSFPTREEWLSVFVKYMRPVFAAAGSPLPEKIRISCAFPVRTTTAIGQILSHRLSADQTREIFISPVLSDAARVCDVVIHELVHAALPEGTGHKKEFRRLALKLGLAGKMTATIAGDKLRAWLDSIIPVFLGPYPHSKVASLDTGKKQTTRLVKLQCPACEMIIRTTRQWLEETGAPLCACGGHFAT